MTIEVKQMLIKSTVHEAGGDDMDETEYGPSDQCERESILAECRRLIADILDERRER